MIHPTACIHPSAEVEADVEIGPYCIVQEHAQVARGNVMIAHATVGAFTSLGQDNELHPGCVIGGPPQDKSHRGERTTLTVGSGNVFRETVTVSRGTVKGGGTTTVGDNNLFMAASHAGHDCRVGNEIVLSNAVLLAGHCDIGDRVVLGGAVACHHFVRIGRLAYLGGMTRCVHDVPPFCKAAGDPVRVRGLNVIGMQRAGLPEDQVERLEYIYRQMFRSGVPLKAALDRVEVPPGTLGAELLQHLKQWMQAPKGRYLEQFRTDQARSGQ